MSDSLVIFIYLVSMALASFLLWRFSHIAWYWHLLAAAAAVVLAVTPAVANLGGAPYDMALGSVIIFLLIWGAGEGVVRMLHLHRHV